MRHYRSPTRDQIADVFGHSELARGMQVDDLLACGSRVRVWQPSSRVHARLIARKKTQLDRSGLLLSQPLGGSEAMPASMPALLNHFATCAPTSPKRSTIPWPMPRPPR